MTLRWCETNMIEQITIVIGRVQDDEQRRREIDREAPEQTPERLDAPAHRGADDDDVSTRERRT